MRGSMVPTRTAPGSHHREEVAEMAHVLGVRAMALNEELKGELEIPRLLATINAIIAGYQISVGKTLGKSFTGLTQHLVNEVGDLIVATTNVVDSDSLAKAIERALRESGVARQVEVVEEEPRRLGGRLMRRIRVVVRDSIFRPVYTLLLRKGYSEFPLSPEAVVAASVARSYMQRRRSGARVNVHARIVDDNTLELNVTEISALQDTAAKAPEALATA